MKLSLAITTFNRFEMTVKSFANVIDHPAIDDIIILDDASTDGSYEKLRDFFSGNEKIRVLRQLENKNMSRNKVDAVSYARNKFCILFDSDNVLHLPYINSFLKLFFESEPDENTIYCPDLAAPTFSFKKFSGQTFDKENIKELVSDDMGNCCMNCCNYIVPVKTYIDVYEYNPEHIATDTIHFNWLWLKAGNKFHIVEGMGYDHTVHNGSGFMKDVNYNMRQAEIMRKKIFEL